MTTLPETGMAPTKPGNVKTTMRDGRNRPVVVVTGMGVITSLGEGKTENWKKLTAGESGISTIRRFSTHGLKTRIAGTIDFIEVKPFSSTTLAERLANIAAKEALGQSGVGRKGDFPGPLFLGLAPIEVEWPEREEIARASGEAGAIDYDVLLRTSAGGRFAHVHSSLKTERTARRIYRTRDDAKADVFDYIERFYNPKRRHSTIGYLSPMEFERQAGLA